MPTTGSERRPLDAMCPEPMTAAEETWAAFVTRQMPNDEQSCAEL